MHGVVVHIWMLYFPIFLLRMCNAQTAVDSCTCNATRTADARGTRNDTRKAELGVARERGLAYRLNIV